MSARKPILVRIERVLGRWHVNAHHHDRLVMVSHNELADAIRHFRAYTGANNEAK